MDSLVQISRQFGVLNHYLSDFDIQNLEISAIFVNIEKRTNFVKILQKYKNPLILDKIGY